MSKRRLALCVSTSKPSLTLTPGGGGGSVTCICPHTGSILSSLRASGDNMSKSLLGISSLSAFPSAFGPLVMAFGGTMNKKDDTYGMLMSFRSLSLPPVINWKCRIPENQCTAGLIVSPCGHYTVAGAISGNIYVWSSLGGSLLRTVKAHYRSVTALSWSDCGAYLVTGGADGMVHAFSLMDLVDKGLTEEQSISPVRTWSAHHLPVTALQPMPSSRIISASEDGQIIMMELFSEITLVTLQLQNGIHSLAFHDGRIYAGSHQGTIFTIDMDVFAMQQTAQLGVTIKRRRMDETHHDQIYMKEASDAYMGELCGHEKGVTALAIVAEDSSNVWLVSGDETGTLRVWDLATRSCIRVIQPWSHSVRTLLSLEEASSSTMHPITSILVVPQEQDGQLKGSFASSKEDKANLISNLVTPLQRFSEQLSDKSHGLPVPFLVSKRDHETLKSWDHTGGQTETAYSSTDIIEKSRQQVQKLEQELAEAKSTIAKLENVDNKFITN